MKFKDFLKEEFTFPDGSYHCKLDNFLFPNSGVVIFEVQNFDFVKLATQVDAVRRTAFNRGGKPLELHLRIPYIPSARQDRLCDEGEPFTAKVVAGLINSLEFDRVFTVRPHSEVMSALVDNLEVLDVDEVIDFNKVREPSPIFNPVLVAPDLGASKATQKLADKLGWHMIQAFKDRDPKTGKINFIGVKEKLDPIIQYIVVDDVCAMGGTFLGLADNMRENGAERIDIVLAHVDKRNGLDKLIFKYDNIYTTNSQSGVEAFRQTQKVHITDLF